ncbi:MAG: DUF5681 domain-containing protein [Devosia sp.]
MTGYRKPPKDTRFQKGKSGNPNGRPRKPKNPPAINDLILEVANQTVTGREGDRTTQMTAFEGALKAQLKSAFGGSPIAQRDWIATATRAAAQKQEEIDEEIGWANDYIRKARALFADAAKKGLPEPELSCHPDDIIIDEQRGILFTGSAIEGGWEAIEKVVKVRDALLLQSVLDDRNATQATLADPENRPGGALLLMFLIERVLPTRFRLTRTQLIMKDWPYRRTRKRELVRLAYQTWKAAGLKLPRGTIFPSFAIGVGMAEEAFVRGGNGHSELGS